MSRIVSGLVACLLAASAVAGGAEAAPAAVANAETGLRAIEGAYHQLLRGLERCRGTRPDDGMRREIVAAAQAFQSAIKRDGGARPDLMADAHNIIASLDDGSFSAEGSVSALRRDAKGSVIDAGPWTPALKGRPVPGPIGTHLDQSNEGDCVGISVVKAFSNTQAGAAILRKVIAENPDGSFNVSLPGDPATVYNLRPGDLDQYGKNDPPAAALVGALFRYFHLDPSKGALPTNKVMELLAGDLGDHARLADAETTPQGITDFLMRNAGQVGGRMAMVFGGKADKKGDWSKGDGHAFAVIRIDPGAGTLTYTNPWNEEKTRTMSIADLARQAAGTSADFETVTFR